MAITIEPVTSPRQKRAFYNFAWRVYRHDPCWVPHLWPARKEYLDRRAAFFSYGEGQFWLAYRDGELVGTIGTGIDHVRNQHLGEQMALFGFFEVLPDYDAAAAMWDHAAHWARERGLMRLLGPQSFTPNEDPGFLVEGFETGPAVLMSHCPPYYHAFAERYGFKPGLESLAYRIEMASLGPNLEGLPPAMFRVAERARQRHGAVIRNPRLEDWEIEIDRLHAVYNRSLAVLPEFTPMPREEFAAQALALKSLLDPDLVFIATVEGQTAGFALGLININEAFKHAGGLRYPWDYLRLLAAQRRIKGASFKILAMDPAYWGWGLDALMYVEMARAVQRKGFTWVDASLTAADNPQTNKLAARAGMQPYRRYRAYSLDL